MRNNLFLSLFDLNDGDPNFKFLRSEFNVVCQDEKFKTLEAEKYPWLDKGLDGAHLPDPIDPEEFAIDQCRAFDDWIILENTAGGFIDQSSETTNFTRLQMQALLTEDAVGIIKSDSSPFYYLSVKTVDHFLYEDEPGTTFFKKPDMPCEICHKSVGWAGYHIDDHTICYLEPDGAGKSFIVENFVNYSSCIVSTSIVCWCGVV